MIYLDAAATAPVRREVLEAMWPLFTSDYGNPSSHHTVGESAARALDYARRLVATELNCRPADVVFTSGGTEADNLAIKGIALATPRGRHIVASAIEHPAVLETLDYLKRLHGFRITLLPVTSAGLVEPEILRNALAPDTTLCTIMYANNEVGTVQPLPELARICREYSVPFHTDAVQAAGWLPLDTAELGVDAMSISGHKLGAPKGSGVLFARSRIPLEPLIHGGGQERGKRSGTENVAGAVAVATAICLAQQERESNCAASVARRNHLINTVLTGIEGAILTGDAQKRLPNLASFCFPGASGEAILLELERAGVISSSGSACAAGDSEPSTVLLALGIDSDIAQTALRLSWTPATTDAEIALAARSVVASVRAVQALK
ncbi:aminotransferase class V-fold PLP-dependent enzyme [Arthrobacter sp. JZ12]|uniref:cysteine desulfurase family protein n=1 Tax=Arthrobacter sp. JZ12 TaxID=2654190 RepID=UPI002B467045|nr:cysteine desulfurase family protein [Arthrobacter sp. JZ12]WRH25208.1 aminotransferase class V-fold PLP-dependent enzyme [Arthrobacter sp. JZ12]